MPYGDKILKERTRVTYGQEEMIVDYMESKHLQNGYPIFSYSESYYKRAFGYLLDQRGIQNESLKSESVYLHGNHFLIYRTDSDYLGKAESYLEKYTLEEVRPFGTLTALYLLPRPEAVTAQDEIFTQNPGDYSNVQEDGNVQKRYIWEEVWKQLFQ